MEQDPSKLLTKKAKIPKKKDPVLEHIDALNKRVGDVEEEAQELAGERFSTIGTAVLKTGLGGASIIDALIHNIGLYSVENPNVMGVLIGSALIVWGLKDAGEIPYKFRKARELLTDARSLRSSLTRSMEEAIAMVPYRKLEQLDSPAQDKVVKLPESSSLEK